MSRRAALLAGALATVGAIGGLAFSPIVRAAARSAADRRHVEITIGSVRPGWFAVRLLDVVARPEGVSAVSVKVDEARVSVGFWFRVERLELHGVAVSVRGSVAEVGDELARWREPRRPDVSMPSVGAHEPPVVTADDLSLRWQDEPSLRPQAEIDGFGAVWDDGDLRWRAASARLRTRPLEIALTDGSGELDRNGAVVRVRAAGLVVDIAPDDAARSDRAVPSLSTHSDPSTHPDPSAHTDNSTHPEPATHPDPVSAADPAAPLLPLPDTHALRARLAALATVLATRIREGADVGVDAVTWRIARLHENVPFTLGPGPLTIARADGNFDVKYSTDPSVASTPLAIRAALPAHGDASISLEGGPVSLSLLGVQEGGAGLVDVSRATITGRARLVLADDGSALTFDGEGGARDVSLANPRLAVDVVRGLDFQARARGTATADGELRIDDLAASVGAVHLAGGGVLDQTPDHVAGTFHFEVPRASCQSLLESLPSALLPALQGTRFAGNFGARGRFDFDSRSLDTLGLNYDVGDECKVTQVPPELARERFQQPFSHRIYLPDGTLAEETTGPGTDNWTPLDEISPYMQVAVLTTEDGGFPLHHGFNRASIRLSLIANLKARRFVRGASTITMQLAKNLFLVRDKTLSRKLEELVLTDYLEQTFSKDELMELYLNVIEFGPDLYGITAAADHYFGRSPAELNLAECLFLSSLLPAPLRYGAMRENAEAPEGWMRMLRNLMQIAHRNGRITDAELAESETEPVVFWHGGDKPPPRPPVRARTELEGDTGDVFTAPPLDAPVTH